VIDKHSRTLTLIDGKQFRPAGEDEVIIDPVKTANALSLIIGFPVKAEDIEYLKVVDKKSLLHHFIPVGG
jgi:hypothetical protein